MNDLVLCLFMPKMYSKILKMFILHQFYHFTFLDKRYKIHSKNIINLLMMIQISIMYTHSKYDSQKLFQTKMYVQHYTWAYFIHTLSYVQTIIMRLFEQRLQIVNIFLSNIVLSIIFFLSSNHMKLCWFIEMNRMFNIFFV